METAVAPNGFEREALSKPWRILNPCVGDPRRKVPADTTGAPGSGPEELSQPGADWVSRTSGARATGKNVRSDRGARDRRLGTRDALFPVLRRVSANHRAPQVLAV